MAMFAISMLSMFAQKIDKDIYRQDGSRTIISDDDEFKDDQSVCMIYEISKESMVLYKFIRFTIEDHGKMEAGRSLLIKFDDESVMELKNYINVYAHPVGSHWGAMCIQPMFAVTDEQLDTICSKNIVKLRFEQADDIIDIKVKRNKLSKLILRCRTDIETLLSKKKRDIHSDF